MYVSSNTQADQIRVTIYGFSYFADTLGNFMKVPTVLNSVNLPKMIG